MCSQDRGQSMKIPHQNKFLLLPDEPQTWKWGFLAGFPVAGKLGKSWKGNREGQRGWKEHWEGQQNWSREGQKGWSREGQKGWKEQGRAGELEQGIAAGMEGALGIAAGPARPAWCLQDAEQDAILDLWNWKGAEPGAITAVLSQPCRVGEVQGKASRQQRQEQREELFQRAHGPGVHRCRIHGGRNRHRLLKAGEHFTEDGGRAASDSSSGKIPEL